MKLSHLREMARQALNRADHAAARKFIKEINYMLNRKEANK